MYCGLVRSVLSGPVCAGGGMGEARGLAARASCGTPLVPRREGVIRCSGCGSLGRCCCWLGWAGQRGTAGVCWCGSSPCRPVPRSGNVLCTLGGLLPVEGGRPCGVGWCRPPRPGDFPFRGYSSFILPPCCSRSPVLWPFPLPSPAPSAPVSVWWVLLWRAAGWSPGGRGVVALVAAACCSRFLPSWVYPSHPVRGLVCWRDSVWWMRLLCCQVWVGRLACHGGRVSLGLSLFEARALVRRRPVGAPPIPGVVHPRVALFGIRVVG